MSTSVATFEFEKDDIGSLMRIVEKFLEEPCCPGHKTDAKRLLESFIEADKDLLASHLGDLLDIGNGWED